MLFVIVLLLEILAGAEMDIFIPSFPELQHVFGVSPFVVELLLSVNFCAYCVASLIIGSLGDRIGRRIMILSGLGVFLFGSALCVFADSFWVLLAGRFLQGIGIAGPAVLGYVVIADMYTLEKRQQLMGLLNGVTTLAMAFAPVVGSCVSLYFSYRGNFVVLLGLAGVTFLGAYQWLPFDQKKAQTDSFQTEGSYRDLFNSSTARSYVAALCLLITPYWIFTGFAPILYMEDLGVPLRQFGYYQGAMVAGICIANFGCGYLLKRLGQRTYFYSGLYLCVFSVVTLFWGGQVHLQDPLLITIIMMIFAFGLVFPVNVLYPASLEIVKNTRGRMSALIVSTRLLMSALGLEVVGYFYDQALSTLSFVLIFCFCIALYIIVQLARNKEIFIEEEKIVSPVP
jgi:DHA1 family bicyclomycin/chloramphenicol resistance-like MFS transporter